MSPFHCRIKRFITINTTQSFNYSSTRTQPSSNFEPLEFKSSLARKLRLSISNGPSLKTLLIEKVFSLKNAGLVDNDVLQQIDKFVHSDKIDALNPKEYCIILRYCIECKLGKTSPVIKVLADFVSNPKFASEFNPHGISTALNAFSRIEGRFEKVFDVFADFLTTNRKSITKFNPKAISMTLNAFSKSQIRNEKVFKVFGDFILEKKSLIGQFGSREIASVLNSYTKLGIADRKLFSLFSSRIVNDPLVLALLNAQDVSTIANAYSKPAVYDEKVLKLFQILIQENADLVSTFKTKEVAVLLNAFSKVRKGNSKVFKMFGDRIVKNNCVLADLEGRSIAIILTAFLTVKVPHYHLYQACGEVILDDAKLRSRLAFRDISCLMHAYGKAEMSTSIKVKVVEVLLKRLLDTPSIVEDGKNDTFAFFQISESLRLLGISEERWNLVSKQYS